MAGVTCVRFVFSLFSIYLLVFLHEGVVLVRYDSPEFFGSFSIKGSMCVWRNLHLTLFVFTGDGLKHRPVPDLTLGMPFNPPEGLAARLCWFLGLPINIAYFFTIPDVKRESCQKCRVVVCFIVCIAWIAVSSYTLVWMVTIIGYTFEIPDAVMGLTLVAFGSSVPDCSSSLFIARKGKLCYHSSCN